MPSVLGDGARGAARASAFTDNAIMNAATKGINFYIVCSNLRFVHPRPPFCRWLFAIRRAVRLSSVYLLAASATANLRLKFSVPGKLWLFPSPLSTADAFTDKPQQRARPSRAPRQPQ